MWYRLSNRRYEEIKNIIVSIFIKLNINCIPINTFELATKLGIKIVSYSAFKKEKRVLLLKMSKDGFFQEHDDGEVFVYYNDKKSYDRINFTLMHEIGHIVLDHTQESDLAEAEANFFAKYALAPPVLIHKLELKSPVEISNIFDISHEAAYNSWNYYNTWLKYGGSDYTKYELQILSLFNKSA